MIKRYLWYAWSVTAKRYFPIGISSKHRGMFPSDLRFGLDDCHVFSVPFKTSY